MVKTGSGHNAAPGVAINTVSRLQSEAKTLSEQVIDRISFLIHWSLTDQLTFIT